ncbi:Putative peptidoglycan binding domain-containing protein [Amphibacillus marinus]|uniref:Putative peptidoglycan binding domain-containing protein n=1 Tax=Amphibacillus marinus TaxID=872970 RepID=A0A1H8LCI2_9BACI|nr:peptidoglycan-binding domain-containing protein [Amphibacillus marinus]SEO02874.1 Putative peptidoglycan binding domain-containing protein [Amphibacillus marinus]
MNKKWLVLLPVITLMILLLPFQSAEASTTTEEIQEGYEALFNWPPEEQPIVSQGSQSFEVEFIQMMLVHFDHETEIDGIFGPHTDQQLRNLQAEYGLIVDGIVGVQTWTLLLDEYRAQLFSAEDALSYAEDFLNNEDLVFSSDGVRHTDDSDNVFYSIKVQSQELIDGGGSGTVGFYDVYQDGTVIEAHPK